MFKVISETIQKSALILAQNSLHEYFMKLQSVTQIENFQIVQIQCSTKNLLL